MIRTSFVALLFSFSIAAMSFLYRGLHTVAAYYRCSRTVQKHALVHVCKCSEHDPQISISFVDLTTYMLTETL